MTMSSGFFDSVDHDRRYTALQWGQIMDYLVNDGVYLIYPETGIRCDENGNFNKTIQPFHVSLITDHDSYFNPGLPAVAVGPGRAWFDHTWTWVQSAEIVQIPEHRETVPRVDVLVLTMDKSFPQRSNYFRVLQGTPGVTDWQQAVTLQGAYMHNDDVHDVPIAYIDRRPGEDVTSSDIHSLVGTSLCPYVTNVASGSFDVSELFDKWDADWRRWIEQLQKEYDAWHELFGNSEDEWKQEWGAFLDNRAADFMRWLKMYDRAYHVWYQGSVNWVYEYIRNLQSENEEFEAQWADVIQKAQDLLEHGLEQYTQKIEDIIDRLEGIDNLVDEKMTELQQQVDKAIEDAKAEIQNGIKELITEVITEQMSTIVEQVVREASPDILADLRAQIENVVSDVMDTQLEDKLTEMEKRLEALQDEKLASLENLVNQVVQNYNEFRTQVEENIWELIKQAIGDQEEVQQAIKDAVAEGMTQAVQGALRDVREEWCNGIKEDIEGQVQQAIDDGIAKLEPTLDQKVNDKFDEVRQEVIDSADAMVKERIDKALASVYKPKGTVNYEDLPQGLSADAVGNVYDVADGFTTDDRFLNPGETYPPGTNVVVVEELVDGEKVYKYDVLPGFIDMDQFVKKDDLDKFQQTITSQLGDITQQLQAISDRLDKDFLEAG